MRFAALLLLWALPLWATAQAESESWSVPASATRPLGQLLQGLAPELTYRSASVRSSVVLVEACPKSGRCLDLMLSYPGLCSQPVGPFCVEYPSRQPTSKQKAAVARAFARGNVEDFWFLPTPPTDGSRSDDEDSDEDLDEGVSTIRRSGRAQDPRTEGVPSPWAVSVALAAALAWAGVALARRWSRHRWRRRMVVPAVLLVSLVAILVSGRPLLWDVLASIGFFGLAFGIGCLQPRVALRAVVGLVVAWGIVEVAGRLRGRVLAPPGMRVAEHDPSLVGRMSPAVDGEASCRVMDSPSEVWARTPPRRVVHLVPSGGLASAPVLAEKGGVRYPVPGGPFVRAQVATALVDERKPRRMAVHLRADHVLRRLGEPLPCCAHRAPFRLVGFELTPACKDGMGDLPPSTLDLLMARSPAPALVSGLSGVSVAGMAATNALADVRWAARGQVPGRDQGAEAVARLFENLTHHAARRGSRIVIVLEPDLEAFAAPNPDETAASLSHDALAQALLRRELRVVDLWEALDRSVDASPGEVVVDGVLSNKGRAAMTRAFNRAGFLRAPRVSGGRVP